MDVLQSITSAQSQTKPQIHQCIQTLLLAKHEMPKHIIQHSQTYVNDACILNLLQKPLLRRLVADDGNSIQQLSHHVQLTPG